MILSIVIPVYEGEALVGETLDSLLRQGNLKQLELVVVNDGSKDGTAEVVGKWMEKHGAEFGAVQFLDLVDNVGVAGARNRGLDAAQGEWVMMMDGDDVLMDGALGQMMEGVNGLGVADLDVVYSPLKISKEVKGMEFGGCDFEAGVMRGCEFYDYYRGHSATGVSVDASCSIWFRRRMLEGYGLRYTEGMVYLEDGEFLGRVFSVARKCVYQVSPYYVYRIHGGSVSFQKKIFDYPALEGYMKGLVSLQAFGEKYLDAAGKRFLQAVVIKISLLPFQAVVGLRGLDWKKHGWVKKKMVEGGFYPIGLGSDTRFYVDLAARVNRWILGYYLYWWWNSVRNGIRSKLKGFCGMKGKGFAKQYNEIFEKAR